MKVYSITKEYESNKYTKTSLLRSYNFVNWFFCFLDTKIKEWFGDKKLYIDMSGII